MTALYFYSSCVLILVIFIENAQPTCVLESDFGFKINCAFKKSGLFRVRNLGGIKAHASLGFSLGDELGFEQSLTNLDQSRRRSVNVKNGVPQNFIADTSVRPTAKQEKRGKQNRIMMRPMAPATRPNQAAMDKLSSLHRRVSSTMKPIVVSGPTVETPTTLTRVNPTVTMAKPMQMGVPPFKPLPPKEETLKVLPIAASTRKSYTPLQVPQMKGPTLYQNSTSVNTYAMPTTINPFVPMPIAVPPTQALTIIPAPVLKDSVQSHAPSKTPTYLVQNSISFQKTNPVSNFVDPVPHQVHDLASMYPAYNTKKADDYNSITGYGDDTTLKFNKEDINAKIAEIAKAGNISMEAVEAAIALRQQQLLNKYANLPLPTSTTSTTTTTTTTEEPLVFQPEPEPEIIVAQPQKPKRIPTTGKVMNAPREYYPVGYEKNFDDHFQSKVDLPDTNFHCGDQKYFPGLYGDESLGCMVFHVCALTDDGLVMKSFLCPESTLFDQTILKCNWWFYVDCKNTRSLYDTNIPVSKSYQLMKALTFFSSYKKEMQENGASTNPEDVTGIKEAISILENHDPSKPEQVSNTANALQIVTPQPIIDERHNKKASISNDTSPVYRGTRNYNDSSKRISAKRKSPDSQNKSPETKSSEEQLKPTETYVPNTDAKLITVTSGFSFQRPENSTKTQLKETSSDAANERKHKRRMTLRNNTDSSTTTTLPPVQKTIVNNTEIKQEKLTDQLDKINPGTLTDAVNSPPVKRFYRSSAENLSSKLEKEIAMVKNEKVQIVRPTPMARLVGEHATPTVTIAKLDEAVLGSSHARVKKEAIDLVRPLQNANIRSPTNRYRT